MLMSLINLVYGKLCLVTLKSNLLTSITYKGQLLTRRCRTQPEVLWIQYSSSQTPAQKTMKTIPIEDMQPVSSSEIRSFLNSASVSFTEGHCCYITTCPRHCRRRMKISELDKLYINTTTGYFVCNSCKKSGSWAAFKENTIQILELTKQKKRLSGECLDGINLNIITKSNEVSKITDEYQDSLPVDDISDEELFTLCHRFGFEVLKKKTLKYYGVRVRANHNGFVMPVYNFSGALAGVKLIYKSADSSNAQVETRTIPRMDYDGLFGWNTVSPGDKEVVITANELDAMAVYQETGLLTLSLPKGGSILPQKLLPQFEQFSKIIIWFGGDTLTWQSSRHFAHKLNDKRCFLIRPDNTHPNALSAAIQGLELKQILKTGKLVQHKSIVSFRNLRYDVQSLLANVERASGIKWKRYPLLNTLLKGHRRGELTVFTGPTGSGKTTFISDYSLDLCQQGVNTLWGSFEINNVRLVKTMLTQYAQLNLSKNMSRFNEFADAFEQLPMYFMTFHGQENIKKVIETMSHAVYVHDIAHVIVDNLQFMLGVDSSSSSMAADRFYRQDIVISLFRSFATNMNCHVTLVIHPRKERDADDLTVSSIFGSAKVSQEADNILILQDKRLTSLRGRKFVQVAKNRFDGELGIMLLKFDKETLSFCVKSAKD